MATAHPKTPVRSHKPVRWYHSKKKRRRRELTQTQWASEQESGDTGINAVVRQRLLKLHGDFSLAYSTMVQPRLNHFGGDEGYIAHRSRWGVTFALGDPVADDAECDDLLARFIRDQRGLTRFGPTFCQISESTAERLHDQGYFINQAGVDTTLHLDRYDFSGKEKEWLRYAANWTARRGYQIRECNSLQLPARHVIEVSEAWRQTRTVKNKEVRFLNRPIVLEDEPDVRKFYLFDPDDQLLAYIFLDPLYRDGGIRGYVTSIKRRHPDAPQYAEHAIMKHLIETLKNENVLQLKLGLSPMAWMDDNRFRNSWLTRQILSRTYQSKLINRRCYNLVGHANYKRRFRGDEQRVYVASPTRLDSMRLFILTGLCGIA